MAKKHDEFLYGIINLLIFAEIIFVFAGPSGDDLRNLLTHSITTTMNPSSEYTGQEYTRTHLGIYVRGIEVHHRVMNHFLNLKISFSRFSRILLFCKENFLRA